MHNRRKMLKFIDSIQILKKKIDENISYKEGVEHACRIFKSQGSKRLHVYIYIYVDQGVIHHMIMRRLLHQKNVISKLKLLIK